MNTEALRTLLDTIDTLDVTLDTLNLADGVLAQQHDDLPYGAIYNARKVCITTLLGSVATADIDNFHGARNVVERFTSLLVDCSARGALNELRNELADAFQDLADMLNNARLEHVHQDEIDDLAEQKAVWASIYRTIRDIAADAAA